MRNKKISLALVAILSLSISVPAFADEASDRAAKAAAVAARWNPIFDQQYAQLTALAAKAKLDPAVLKSYNYLINDFLEVRRVIDSALASPTGDIDAAYAYAEEETGEFMMTIPQLAKQVALIKTISCVKGKTVKKVTGISAKCPSGYKKK
jgi:hypothetical protein